MDIPILLYHSVCEKSATRFSKWTVSPEVFAEHLAYIKDNGYLPMTITQLAKAIQNPANNLPARAIGITFDDGFEDFYYKAMPILTRFNFPATIYITTAYVGRTSRWLQHYGEGQRRMLDWWQIDELAHGGVEVGAHTLHHHQLDTVSRQVAFEEISGSKKMLENRLGNTVCTFAYPHGYHNPEIRDLVKRAGFTSACAVKHGLSSLKDDPFALARIIVTRNTSTAILANLLKGIGLEKVTQKERFRTTGWRVLRQIQNWFSFWLNGHKG